MLSSKWTKSGIISRSKEARYWVLRRFEVIQTKGKKRPKYSQIVLDGAENYWEK